MTACRPHQAPALPKPPFLARTPPSRGDSARSRRTPTHRHPPARPRAQGSAAPAAPGHPGPPLAVSGRAKPPPQSPPGRRARRAAAGRGPQFGQPPAWRPERRLRGGGLPGPARRWPLGTRQARGHRPHLTASPRRRGPGALGRQRGLGAGCVPARVRSPRRNPLSSAQASPARSPLGRLCPGWGGEAGGQPCPAPGARQGPARSRDARRSALIRLLQGATRRPGLQGPTATARPPAPPAGRPLPEEGPRSPPPGAGNPRRQAERAAPRSPRRAVQP